MAVTVAQLAAGGAGYIPYKKTSANTTNATSLKTTQGFVGAGVVHNAGAGAAWLKFYDKATAPAVGTDVPIYVVGIPAAATVSFAMGDRLAFAAGIAFAITGGAADGDTTAVATSQVSASFGYL